jgi:DNA-binding GntR family transcriptional regulator
MTVEPFGQESNPGGVPVTLDRPKMLTEGVYDVLRNQLISGIIRPDDAIRIDVVARQLGVSSTPIRQAMGRLAAEGLVYQIPHRGFIAASPLDLRRTREYFDLRSMIEPVSAQRAAALRTDPDLKALTTYIDGPPEASRWALSADESLHLTIAEIAGNRTVVDMLERLFIRSRSGRLAPTPPNAENPTNQEHRAIVEAITHGDAESARAAMEFHLVSSCGRIAAAAGSSDGPTQGQNRDDSFGLASGTERAWEQA